MDCKHCQTCQRRSDWDFLKDFFFREQSLLGELDQLKTQHARELQELHSTNAALRLSYCSVKGHFTSSQDQTARLERECEDLNTRYNHMFGQLKAAQMQNEETQDRISDLEKENSAKVALLHRHDLDQKAGQVELDAAQAAAQELGDLLNKIVSADDFAASAFAGAINIADLMLRNKYQEAEIEELKRKAGIESVEELWSTPLLSFSEPTASETKASHSYVPLAQSTDCDECDGIPIGGSSAHDEWEAYKAAQPLNDDDLP